MKKLVFILICALFALSACDKKSTTNDTSTNEQPAAAAENQAGEEKPESAEQKLNAEEGTQAKEGADNPLLDPSKATLTAPAKYKAKFETTKGDFIVDVDRSLSPLGADRFYNLVKNGFYDNVAFFRVIDGFMAQFGMNGDPAVTKAWQDATIDDEPVKSSNTRGAVTFAKTGAPNSRTTQLFINFGNNANLDGMGFAPFGSVEGDGMKVVDQLYNGYGEGAPRGEGPSQDLIREKGNAYLKENFPKLDYIKSVKIIEE